MEQLIRSLGNLVYLDANIVVYAVEGYPAFRERICAFLETSCLIPPLVNTPEGHETSMRSTLKALSPTLVPVRWLPNARGSLKQRANGTSWLRRGDLVRCADSA